jgi:hypothetical protein
MKEQPSIPMNESTQSCPPGNCAPTQGTSQSIEWFHEGETRIVRVNNVQVSVRFVGRRGRRARIAIEAPAGAVFRSLEPK